jgi:GntR family transcriptional regulator
MDDPRVFMQVADELRGQIRDGHLKPGNPVPSITTVCQKAGYSRRTVGHAMQILEREGLIKRYPGVGYYVT